MSCDTISDPTRRDRAETIINSLISMRKRWNLSQEHVADILGVHLRTFIKWEAHETAPTLDHLAAWANSLGCDVQALFRK